MARIICQTLDKKMGFSNVITVVSWFPYEKQLKKTLEKNAMVHRTPERLHSLGLFRVNRNFSKPLLINRKLKMFARLKHINW